MRRAVAVPMLVLIMIVGLLGVGGPAAARPAIDWEPCARDAGAECGFLTVPVDWARPGGATMRLAVARRLADPAQRVGALVFGPGGPGDSGVDRIIRNDRFSPEVNARFDRISLDPRGVGGSNPVVCDPALLAARPPVVLADAREFARMVAYNARLRADCRARTGPVFDHASTLSTVRDLEALRIALGEPALTFHGSSYGTLLGAQYAEAYPGRVRALVLESVDDHSLGTRPFVLTQAAAADDAFAQFVAWCAANDSCALRGRDVRAVWAGLRSRAGAGTLPGWTDFDLGVLAFRAAYLPDFATLADRVARLDRGEELTAPALPPLVTAVFCADWALPVGSYRGYAGLRDEALRVSPDVLPVAALYAVAACLGTPRVPNPQHELRVSGVERPLLLLNARHDPATPYVWAENVARQLGPAGVLVTYAGVGHGSYLRGACMTEVVDRYLIDLTIPPPGVTCPAV